MEPGRELQKWSLYAARETVVATIRTRVFLPSPALRIAGARWATRDVVALGAVGPWLARQGIGAVREVAASARRTTPVTRGRGAYTDV